jgi:pimeloyl-ACP methyl ester carboxylesterase
MYTNSEDLPVVLTGERLIVDDEKAGRIHIFADGPMYAQGARPSSARPVLLVHSINASASAHEVKPLYDELKRDRPTYALDLPGFGHSEHSDRDYLQSLMVEAIVVAARTISRRHGSVAVDALAVSLSCEFLAKAAIKRPELIRSLALVSPTGFASNASRKGSAEDDCGRPGVLRFLKRPKIGTGLYRLLSSAPSIRFFLRKTWGSKQIDEEMFETSCAMAKHPNAHRAPFYFLSGFLFSANIGRAYRAIEQPVWMSHGTRGDFTDYSRKEAIEDRANWQITVYEAGALPYFEVGRRFTDQYRAFLATEATETPQAA